MNEEITSIFKDFTVDELVVPVSFCNYFGEADTFVVWQPIDNSPALASDDEINYSRQKIDFDMYSKTNYAHVESQIKKLLKENDYMWVDDAQEQYEPDTGYYHKTMTFIKERMV